MKYFVGAYAASPCLERWDPELESHYYHNLRRIEKVGGLELPFYQSFHRYDKNLFIQLLDPRWSLVITTIPGIMERLRTRPDFGLASNSNEGRRLAIDYMRTVRDSVHELNDSMKNQAVKAIFIHSAPSQNHYYRMSSAEMFLSSLEEILSWDWNGTEIMVEHCDAFTPRQAPAKGFLSLDEEIWALEQIRKRGMNAGLAINWGRSVLEGRSVETAVYHIRRAKEVGFLGSLIFSGVAVNDPVYGDWQDSHAPFAAPGTASGLSKGSLMTAERVKESLKAADVEKLRVLGFKIQALPQTLSLEDRIQLIENSTSFLDSCLA